MRNFIALSIIGIFLLSSCRSELGKFRSAQEDLMASWIKLYETSPFVSNAIYDVDKLKDEKPFLEKISKIFNSIDETEIPEIEKVEFLATKKLIEERIDFLEIKIKKDPSVFSLKKELETLITETNQGQENVLENALTTIEKIPRYFEFAKSSLQQPELENINRALEEQKVTYFLLKNEIPQWAKKNATTSLALNHFSKKNKEAQLAIKDWIAFLNSAKFEIGNATD